MNKNMRVFGIAGWSGSGKTTLLCHLLPELISRGLTVATMKYTHHDFDFFEPGHVVTTWREAGADEVLYVSDRRWALLHELRAEPEPPLEELYEQFSHVDLLLIEGFKHHDHAKLEVHRAATGLPLRAAEDEWVVAVASDSGRPEGVPEKRDIVVLDLNDISAVADFILAHCDLKQRRPDASRRRQQPAEQR
ncbi:MAG: molybdopterin-guanine dinucleotide biosynthesis protein B [Alphaproteobacteria bacterium]|nr:molybdopterin-guanine dinucleotide biosynthesis protein B [Alphaproteobacteria bacterium]MDP6590236.1 molybdopterin-guanine dinucleotide biosynthesis protein B [Alphaproteobacteria bacterium]MDP6817848.1 molybdopterin-guanine dinucleotide biosynthesis protein B [Alphaproteobacteria bacterium]